LGKNYALYRGAEEAGGEWLLFTDADVRFAPGCIEDAMHYAQSEDLDHLTLTPELVSRGIALKCFVAALVLVFGVTSGRGGSEPPALRRRLAWEPSTSSNGTPTSGQVPTKRFACVPTT
jgi:glycosyltransferase involved in cell wall biosynthesis